MRIINRMKALFKGSKPKNEIQQLNESCNKAFQSAFESCKVEYGRELVELMDIKRSLVDTEHATNSITPLQEMLLKKILELMKLYFKFSEVCVSIKKHSKCDAKVMEHLNNTIGRMDKVYSMIGSLNGQFYMRDEDGDMVPGSQDLINEAEALCNVLRENNHNKKMV